MKILFKPFYFVLVLFLAILLTSLNFLFWFISLIEGKKYPVDNNEKNLGYRHI